MSLTDAQRQQVELYGRLLNGSETPLQLAQLARINYLKAKMRPRLAAAIGDYGDNITDATRGLVLGEAIRLGLVTDQTIIDSYKVYVQSMLDGYGGAEAIMAVLQGNSTGLQQDLVQGYYVAKQQVMAAVDADSVQAIDLPGEPKLEVV